MKKSFLKYILFFSTVFFFYGSHVYAQSASANEYLQLKSTENNINSINTAHFGSGELIFDYNIKKYSSGYSAVIDRYPFERALPYTTNFTGYILQDNWGQPLKAEQSPFGNPGPNSAWTEIFVTRQGITLKIVEHTQIDPSIGSNGGAVKPKFKLPFSLGSHTAHLEMLGPNGDRISVPYSETASLKSFQPDIDRRSNSRTMTSVNMGGVSYEGYSVGESFCPWRFILRRTCTFQFSTIAKALGMSKEQAITYLLNNTDAFAFKEYKVERLIGQLIWRTFNYDKELAKLKGCAEKDLEAIEMTLSSNMQEAAPDFQSIYNKANDAVLCYEAIGEEAPANLVNIKNTALFNYYRNELTSPSLNKYRALFSDSNLIKKEYFLPGFVEYIKDNGLYLEGMSILNATNDIISYGAKYAQELCDSALSYYKGNGSDKSLNDAKEIVSYSNMGLNYKPMLLFLISSFIKNKDVDDSIECLNMYERYGYEQDFTFYDFQCCNKILSAEKLSKDKRIGILNDAYNIWGTKLGSNNTCLSYNLLISDNFLKEIKKFRRKEKSHAGWIYIGAFIAASIAVAISEY